MPLISVIITTYNHEKYIAQAIESALSQRDCPCFEILIGNDCSTDKTGQIIEEYQKKYPDIIKVFSYSQNIGMQKNLKNLIENSKGEYVAILEGNDYFSSEYNLKKRYDMLKDNPDFSLCFNNMTLLNQETGELLSNHDENFAKILNGKITIVDMIKFTNPIRNFSCCMYRKCAIKSVPDFWFESNHYDWLFNMLVLDNQNFSGGGYLPEELSVYRIHSNGLWQQKTTDEKLALMIKCMCEFMEIFKYRYAKEFMNSILEIANRNLGYIYSLKKPEPKRIFSLKMSVLSRIFEFKLTKRKDNL